MNKEQPGRNDRVVTSPENEQLKLIRALQLRKRREAHGKMLLEGVRFLEEALEAGVQLELAAYSPRVMANQRGQRLVEAVRQVCPTVLAVTDTLMEKLAGTDSPQGVLAVAGIPEFGLEDLEAGAGSCLVVLDGLQDPGNLGTIVRTAAAAGAGGLILGKGTVDLYNPKVLRATMGAVFRLPVLTGVELPGVLGWLKKRDVRLAAADPRSARLYFEEDYTKPTAFLIGNEGSGLSPEVSALAEVRVAIPMASGVESLNAAVSAGLLMYEAVRQRFHR